MEIDINNGMKIRTINIIFLITLFITSCSDDNRSSGYHPIYNLDSESTEVAPTNKDKDNIPSPVDNTEFPNPKEEKEEPANQVLEVPAKSFKTKSFYCGLLDEFCKKFFDRKYVGMHYVPGSLSVENVSEFDSHTIVVKGTHSFKSPIILRNNKEFKATIREDGNNKYHVDFQRYGVRLGGIKSTGSLPFYYNPEE